MKVKLSQLPLVTSQKNSVNEVMNSYSQLMIPFHELLQEKIGRVQQARPLQKMEAFNALLSAREAANEEGMYLYVSAKNDRFLNDHLSAMVAANANYLADLNHFQELAKQHLESVDLKSFESNPILAKSTQLAKSVIDSQSVAMLTVDPRYWWDWMTRRMESMKDIEDQLAENIQTNVVALSQKTYTEAQTSVIVAAGIVTLAILISIMILAPTTAQVNTITEMLSHVKQGDYQSRAKIISQDELGGIAKSLNEMADDTLGLIQSKQERDQIQASIMKLLEEVSDVAHGDLTAEAEVTADFTGAIADAFNFMITQLREVVRNVQNSTLEVSQAASMIKQSAENLSYGSEAQASQISDTSVAIEEMAKSIQSVSKNAAQSAEIAELARTTAVQGTEAVRNTIQGMDRIRDQVQETSKRIKRLGESSQEIGEFTKLIGDIADRTSLLALNASIQAATAGEAGHGFAVVAEEVERLADRANDATKRIASLIHAIQSETNQAVGAMENSTKEVVEGSKLAQEAGKALTGIDKVSDTLAQLIQSISHATKQHSLSAEELAQSMLEISEVTQQTARGTRQAALSISELSQLGDSLRHSVSAFRIPEERIEHSMSESDLGYQKPSRTCSTAS